MDIEKLELDSTEVHHVSLPKPSLTFCVVNSSHVVEMAPVTRKLSALKGAALPAKPYRELFIAQCSF